VAGSQVRNTRIAMGVIVGAVVVAGALGLARPASPGPSPSPAVVAAHESPSPGHSKPPESPAPSAAPLAFEWHTSRVGADLSDLAVTGRGLIAVGWNQRGGIVWVSPDGEDWEIDDDSPTFDGVRLFAVGGNAHETVVVGCQLAGQTCGSGAAWVHGSGSTDRWRRVRGNPFGSASPDRVVATAERVMVRGIDGAGRPAFWVSNDGTRWTRVKSPVARTLEGNGGVLEVGASEKVFLMVGQDATGVDANGYVMGPAMVWT